ncbi:MAG: HNH endonuclease [Candidatus Sedimenticola sp. (ex Thyasira tokunagai)]
MAVTHGHGNPKWTRDETILALDLYFDCEGHMPSSSDERVKELSDLLRSFPHHSLTARKESFRNADGVAFKLQNLRKIATGKGLGNTSKMDRQVWEDLGHNQKRTKELASLIRSGITLIEGIKEEETESVVFQEGKVVTEAHLRRERSRNIRKRLLDQRKKLGPLVCELCNCDSSAVSSKFEEAMFEAHHIQPLATSGERTTKLDDVALLCANCHRFIHKAIADKKRWLSVSEARSIILVDNDA